MIRAFDKVLRGLAVEEGLGISRKEYQVGRVACRRPETTALVNDDELDAAVTSVHLANAPEFLL